MIVQPAVHLAMANADSAAGFARPVRAMEFRPAAAVVSFEARFSPAPDLSAAVPSAVGRCPMRFATAGFVPAADPFDPAGSAVAAAAAAVLVVAVAAVAVVAVAVVAGLSAADLSGVAAADLACSVYYSAAALGKGRVVAVPFYFLILRSSF